jgi:hypothetical protein
MSYRLFELSPQASTRVVRMTPVLERRRISAAARRFSVQDSPPTRSFLQACFEDDSAPENAGETARVNWGVISGMFLSVALSVSIWTGLIWVIGRIWK